MAERVMLALGPFRFEMGQATYQSLAMSQSWRWPEQARIGREPALQFTGREPAEIRLQGVLFPGFDAGLKQVEEMRALADLGKPLQLVDGLGRVWGSWVIVEVGDTRSVLMDDGQPRRVGFEMKLQAYGEDETVTDYSGGWSPFAMLMPLVDDLVNDPVGAITQLLEDITRLDPFTGIGGFTDLAALIAIQNALGELIEAVGAAVRGLHSEWLQVVPDANHPVRQALDAWLASITSSKTALTGSAGLDTQVASVLTALETLRSVLQPLANGGVATSAAIYDLAQRTLPVLDAAQQTARALQEKFP
jgi:phage protein U